MFQWNWHKCYGIRIVRFTNGQRIIYYYYQANVNKSKKQNTDHACIIDCRIFKGFPFLSFGNDTKEKDCQTFCEMADIGVVAIAVFRWLHNHMHAYYFNIWVKILFLCDFFLNFIFVYVWCSKSCNVTDQTHNLVSFRHTIT